MAANFKIVSHRSSDSLHLKLEGDFDGTSACELLNVLRGIPRCINKVLVHTCSLRQIHPFGQDTFHGNLYTLKEIPVRLIFAGKNSAPMAPEQSKLGRIVFCLDTPQHVGG